MVWDINVLIPDSKKLIGASIQYQHDLIEIPCQQLCLVSLECDTVWKVFKYGPEITPYLGTFHAVWAAERWFLWLITHYQIFRTWWWHSIECDVPNLLMQWIAVVMSDMTLMCLWLVFTNNVKATKIAFSSRILICIGFSFGNHALPLDTSPMEALQLSIEVYVLILMLNLGYLIGLKTLNMFFFYHDISWKVSSGSFIIALESPLL